MQKTKKNNYTNENSNKKTKSSNITKTLYNPKLSIGCHASIADGILEAIKYVESIGGNALQIFMGSKLQSSLKYKHKFKDQNEINTIREYIARNKIAFIIHSIYTINLCKFPYTSGRIKYAHDNILYDLKYGQMLGAKCVVLHIGSKNKELSIEEALNNLVGNINHITGETEDGRELLAKGSAYVDPYNTKEENLSEVIGVPNRKTYGDYDEFVKPAKQVQRDLAD